MQVTDGWLRLIAVLGGNVRLNVDMCMEKSTEFTCYQILVYNKSREYLRSDWTTSLSILEEPLETYNNIYTHKYFHYDEINAKESTVSSIGQLTSLSREVQRWRDPPLAFS